MSIASCRSKIDPLDKFIVIRIKDKAPIEGHFSQRAADMAAKSLNRHNEQWQRPDRFEVKPRDQVQGV